MWWILHLRLRSDRWDGSEKGCAVQNIRSIIGYTGGISSIQGLVFIREQIDL